MANLGYFTDLTINPSANNYFLKLQLNGFCSDANRQVNSGIYRKCSKGIQSVICNVDGHYVSGGGGSSSASLKVFWTA